MQKRILVILPSFDRGGSENYALRLITFSDSSEYRWHVTTGNMRNAQMEPSFQMAGATTHHNSPGYADPLRMLAFSRFLRNGAFFAVMSLTGVFGGLSLLLAKHAGVPVRVGWHRRSTPAFRSTLWRRAYARVALHFLDHASTHVLSNSRAALDTFHGPKWHADSRYRVIPNGVDAAAYQPRPELRNVVRDSLGIPRSATVIGHVGRFDPAKDHETLLATVHSLRSRGLDARLLVAGTGTDTGAFKDRLLSHGLASHCYALGPRDDVSRLHHAMDVFLFPSVTEGQPNALIEAILSGIDVVASDIAPVREATPSFLHGCLFPPGDANAAAALVHQHVLEPRAMTAAARHWAKEQYDPDANFEAVLSLMRT